MPSEFLLSTHLPTSEGWELTVSLWLVATGLEPIREDLTRFETLCLNHSATPPLKRGKACGKLQIRADSLKELDKQGKRWV